MTDQPIPPADEQVLEALAAAYSAGATDTHNWWAAGNVEREADFGEAASDYARSIDLTALSLRPAPETTASDGVVEAQMPPLIKWPNGCNRTAPAALRYLAKHDRPIGGEQYYNAAHLMQIADELERVTVANLPKPTEQATSPAPRPNPPVRPGARLPNGDAA